MLTISLDGNIHDPTFDLWFLGLTPKEVQTLKSIESGIDRYFQEHREQTGTILELLNLKHFSHMPPTSLRVEQVESRLKWVELWERWSVAAKAALTKIINRHGGRYELVHGPKWNDPLPRALMRLSEHLEAAFANMSDQKESLEETLRMFKERAR